MRKFLRPLLFILIATFFFNTSFGQCYWQDTAAFHRTKTKIPYGIAISNTGKTAVSAVRTDSAGKKTVIKIWNDVYDFSCGLLPDDSIKLTSPQGLIYDNAGNLYVLQTERTDSNIMIYNSSLSLIKVIDNSPGTATSWFNPRGIALDPAQNLYILSGDSIITATTTYPGSGKLVKITDPLVTATKTLLLSGLNAPKAIVIDTTRLFISESGANKISRYDVGTMLKTDSITITQPMDLTVKQCRLYCTEYGTSTVRIMNSLNLTDASVLNTIAKPFSQHSKFGTQLNDEDDLYVCDHDSARVFYFQGIIPPPTVTTDTLNGAIFCIHTFHALPAGGTWTSANTSVVTISATGMAYGEAGGSTHAYHTVGAVTDTFLIIIETPPPITGPILAHSDTGNVFDSMATCSQSNKKLYATPSGGSWFSSSPVAGVNTNGVVWPNMTGGVDISYGFVNSCGSSLSSFHLRLLGSPDAGAITGDTVVCHGASIPLSASTAGGIWTTGDASIATVDAGGVVHGIVPGNVVITYTTSNVCDVASTTQNIKVDSTPHAGAITGNNHICPTLSTPLVHGPSTGTGHWASRNPAIAGVDASGTVTGVTGGSTTIYYICTNTCGSDTASFAFTVDPLAIAGPVAGTSHLCPGTSTILFAPVPSAGTIAWHSSNNAIATANPSGSVAGVSPGPATIYYVVTTVCNADSTSFPVTVDSIASAGFITGNAVDCISNSGAYVTAGSSVGTGTWVSGDPSILDVDAVTGQLTYMSPGTTFVNYMATTACGYDVSSFVITVENFPDAGGITGPDSVCSGGSITLLSYGANIPGSWSAAGPFSITSTGVVTAGYATMGNLPGTVSYDVYNSCGDAHAYRQVIVKPLPVTGTITGSSTVCSGSAIVLSGVNPGGVWTTSNASIATVSANGMVSGVSTYAGSATITYTRTIAYCGSASTTFPITVPASPWHGYITGADTICQNAFDTLRNFAATPVGSWSSKHGYVSFVTATSNADTIRFRGITPGVDTIIYTVTTACGTDSTLFTLKINGLPLDGTVVGPTQVCAGSSITLANPTATPGGIWLSSDYSVASVDAVTGVVSAYSAGPVVITYSGFTGCGTNIDAQSITVNPVAYAHLTYAVTSVCAGSTVSLDNTGSIGTGTWTSSNTFIATVDATTGVMGGANHGTATITYAVTTPSCGSDVTTLPVTVNPLPVPGTITGSDTVCYGGTTTLTDFTPSGVWSSANSSIAVVSGGVVTGISPTMATTTIRYTVTSASCGTVFTTHSITVKPLPVAAVVSGGSAICRGASLSLYSSAPGGVWSSPSPLVSVNATTGLVTGLNTGTATISYAAVNNCGSTYTTNPVTVSDIPVVSAITCADSICAGTTTVASCAPAPGTWSSRYGLVSTTGTGAGTAGILGVSGGIDTIYYTATNACGYASVARPIKVLTLPNAGYITGADTLCPGATATLANPSGVAGGTWGHSGTHISLSASAVVTALFPGTDTVTYSVSNSCGTSVAVHTVTVNSIPVVGAITGPSGVCVGASVTLTNATGTPGGTWACGAGGTITSGGVFTGVSGGLVTVSYASSTACGVLYAYYSITVNPAPPVAAITGPASVCMGSTATLSDATATGFWSCAPASIATITSSGMVTGVATGAAVVSYAVSNACGTTTVTHTVNVNTLPVVSNILGIAVVCPGASSTLFDGTAGGTWSTTNGNATITSSGMVTGITPGTDTVLYTVTNACGTSSATRIVTVSLSPATDTITGSSIACVGVPVTLTCSITGGTWSASNGNATVTGGVVTGINVGIDTIHYAVTNTCGTAILSQIVTVQTAVIPSVTMGVTPDDTVCGSAPATYVAIPVNGGTAPFIQWKRGTANIGTGLAFSDFPADGDIISCTMASNAACPAIDTVASNTTTMHVLPAVTPLVTIIASVDTIVYLGESVTFTANLINCSSSPVYQWYASSGAITGATSASYTVSATGNDAYYCIAACDIPCAVAYYNHSNIISLHTGYTNVGNVHTEGTAFSLYPNPNTGSFMLTGNTGTNNSPVAIEVIDVTGRTIYTGTATPKQGIITTQVTLNNNVASGHYMLRLITGNGTEVLHFVVGK